jgi:hypothetical protein
VHEREHEHPHRHEGGPEGRGGRGVRGGPRRIRGGGGGRLGFREQRTTAEQRAQIKAWFSGRLPDGWYTGAPKVVVDDDEILITGTLPNVEYDNDASADDKRTAEAARIQRFREDTREERMRIADEAQGAFRRHVAWGAGVGESELYFTTASVPVMTRLRIDERQVLDTLIDAGVARSRSEALAWCVRLVGENESSWISELRQAFEQVERVRAKGPTSEAGTDASAESNTESSAE